jgi:hypothetical protein
MGVQHRPGVRPLLIPRGTVDTNSADSQWGSFGGNGFFQDPGLGTGGGSLPKQVVNWFTLPGTHYCGPGGGGTPATRVDGACAAHDLCYENAGVTWRNNVGLARTTPLSIPVEK